MKVNVRSIIPSITYNNETTARDIQVGAIRASLHPLDILKKSILKCKRCAEHHIPPFPNRFVPIRHANAPREPNDRLSSLIVRVIFP